jgi:hypothetical protein
MPTSILPRLALLPSIVTLVREPETLASAFLP